MLKDVPLYNLPAREFNESSAPIVESICEPLFKNFGITHFGCIRIFEDGQFLRIANNPEWTRRYFECEFYNDLDLYSIKQVPINHFRFMPLIGAPFNKHCMALCSEFNLWNFLLIYERFSDYGDFWFFGTTKNNTEIINFYLNNKSLLKHFTYYFKNKASDLFIKNEPSNLIRTNVLPLQEEAKESKNIESFIKDIAHKKYYLDGKHLGKSLYKREFQSLFFFSQGKTMKEIGEKMQLSPRTIETYINNIKSKLECHTRGELCSIVYNIKIPF